MCVHNSKVAAVVGRKDLVQVSRDKLKPSLVFSGDRKITSRLSTLPVRNKASPRVEIFLLYV